MHRSRTKPETPEAPQPRMSRLAGVIMKQLRQPPTHSGTSKLRQRILRKLRSQLVKTWDPVISVPVNGSRLWMPFSHELPVYSADYPDYSQNIGRIAQIVAEDRPGGSPIIDIGANVGDTAAIVRSYCDAPILCIEGHPLFGALLHRNLPALGANIHIESTFVGTTSGTLQGSWLTGDGTARFLEGDATIPTRTLSDIVKDHPVFHGARLIKIDTDGFDGAIILSELAFLAETLPVLFFEYDPHFYAEDTMNLSVLAGNLKTIGYATMLLYDNLGSYMSRIDLKATDHVQDAESYAHALSGRGGYLDICLFSEADVLLAERIRRNEIALSRCQQTASGSDSYARHHLA